MNSKNNRLPVRNGVSTNLEPKKPPYDLIVFSHLRWDFVYQRPQHIISRLARHRNILFVVEPVGHYSPGDHTYSTQAAGTNSTVFQPSTDSIRGISLGLLHYLGDASVGYHVVLFSRICASVGHVKARNGGLRLHGRTFSF